MVHAKRTFYFVFTLALTSLLAAALSLHARPSYATMPTKEWDTRFNLPGLDGPVAAMAWDEANGALYAAGAFSYGDGTPINGIGRWDGAQWQVLGSGSLQYLVESMVVAPDGKLYIGGSFNWIGEVPAFNVAIWDGSQWSVLGNSLNGAVMALAMDGNGQLYAGGEFTKSGTTDVNHIAVWNGASWQPVGSGSDATVHALAFAGDGTLYAGGDFTNLGGVVAEHLAKWDGNSWSAVGEGVSDGTVRAMAIDHANQLYVAGDFAIFDGLTVNHIAQWDGSAWHDLGSGIIDGEIDSLAIGGDNQLYVGGGYWKISDSEIYNLAQWDGSSWSAVGGSTNGQVRSLLVTGGDTLWVGGDFSRVDSQLPANYIASYGDSSWSMPVTQGEGVNRLVNALAINQAGELYVGGWFDTACQTAQNYLARWDGSGWSDVGGGMDGPVFALTVDDNNRLYAGGDFIYAGSMLAQRVAGWNGSEWQAVGQGVNGSVNALTTDEYDTLYAGGTFDTAFNANMNDTVNANHIVRWDGVSWQMLAEGLNDAVNALAADHNGHLYAGGLFTASGSFAMNHIGLWDGVGWRPLGDGLDGVVYALLIGKDGILYAGGAFSIPGDETAVNVAGWNGESWQPLGTGLSATVHALAMDSSGTLIAGGEYGETNFPFLSQWDGTTWSTPDGNPNGDVYALAVDSGDGLYLGGSFDAVSRLESWMTAWDASSHIASLRNNVQPTPTPTATVDENSVLIDFEGLSSMTFIEGNPIPSEARLNAAWVESYGVAFYSASQPYVAVVNLGSGHATSGMNGIGAANEAEQLTYFEPITIEFVDPANPFVPAVTDYVSVRGDLWGSGQTITLNALDEHGNVIASDSQEDNNGATLVVAASGIHAVQFVPPTDGGVALDARSMRQAASPSAGNAPASSGGIALDDLIFHQVTPIERTTPTPTELPTEEPTPTATEPPTEELTPTPTEDAIPEFVVEWVDPTWGVVNEVNELNVYGKGFGMGSIVVLEEASLSATAQQPLTVTLDTTFIDEHQLYALAPASLAAALYNVTVIQEEGRSSTLANAYYITSPDNDDLYSSSYNLISDPAAPHAGEATQLLLTLYRQGGKNPLAGVTVDFYQGDPDRDGSLIGSATTSIVPVNASVQSSAVNWLPSAPGKYTLCAVIDPANVVSESSEYNNLVCRTITVLPAHADKLAPDITSFELVPDGMEETTAPTLTVSVVASDVVRNGFATSGMSAVTFDEYVYNHANNLWVPIKRSPWTIYSPDAVEKLYDIELSPLPGMRYLKVWAIDNAGNISHFPGERLVNFNQPTQSVQRNQSQTYRYFVEAGQRLKVTVTPISGDPDLYIWLPTGATPKAWVSNLSNFSDERSEIAPVSGEYQIEVFGYSDAEYRISVEITAAQLAALAQQPAGGSDPNKTMLANPSVPLNSKPDNNTIASIPVETPVPGSSPTAQSSKLFLPLVRR